MPGLIGKKVGMTSVFDENGNNVPCTVKSDHVWLLRLRLSKQMVMMQYSFLTMRRKKKNTTKAMLGHFKKAGTTPKRKTIELKGFVKDWKLGDQITVDYFNDDVWLDVIAKSKGKGFQGVVKRHGFAGVNDATHGQHNRNRAPGSLGASSYPSRVFKGMRMAGRDGNKTVKTINLRVVKVLPEQNLLMLKGSVPGANGSYVIIEK